MPWWTPEVPAYPSFKNWRRLLRGLTNNCLRLLLAAWRNNTPSWRINESKIRPRSIGFGLIWCIQDFHNRMELVISPLADTNIFSPGNWSDYTGEWLGLFFWLDRISGKCVDNHVWRTTSMFTLAPYSEIPQAEFVTAVFFYMNATAVLSTAHADGVRVS